MFMYLYVYVCVCVCVCVYIYMHMSASLLCKNMKPLWKVTAFEQQISKTYCSQHRTAQRMTARRSVIHPSFYPSSVLVTVRATIL